MIQPTSGPKTPNRAWRPSPLLGISLGVHTLAAVTLARRPEHWRPIVRLLVANHAALCLAGTIPRSSLLGSNIDRYPEVGPNKVVLTFDDGPDPRATPQVLDLLDRHDARATFFLIGRHAERHPALVEDIVRRGHRIENHTYHHRHDFAFRWYRGLAREIDRAQHTLEGLSGRRPVYFRAPAGMRNPFLDAVLVHRGLRLVSWTHRGFDAVDYDADRIVHRLTHGTRGGDILLLHDGHGPRDRDGRPLILSTLPRLLEWLDGRGLGTTHLPDPA